MKDRDTPCRASVLVGDDRGSWSNFCDLPDGHDGDHSRVLDACQPVARMCWSDPKPRSDG